MISRILFRLWLAASAAWLALVYGLVALTGDPVPTAMDAAVIWGIPAAVFIFGAALVRSVGFDLRRFPQHRRRSPDRRRGFLSLRRR